MLTTLDVALSQVGVKEETGQNDGVPAQRYARGDKVAWCAAFVLWCNERSDDVKIAGDLKEHYAMRSVTQMDLRLTARGWMLGKGQRPQPGDVIFFGNRGRSDVGVTGRHVGLVERVDGDHVHTVEGNYSNQVAKVRHRLDDKRITGFARLPTTSQLLQG